MRNMFLLPLALLLLIGCDVKIDKKAILLRYDTVTDTLEGVGINEGISASKDEKVDAACEIIIKCLEGQRHLQFGPFSRVNFDKDDFSNDPEMSWANHQVHLDSAQIYLDGEDRLSGVQRFHVRQFSQVLSILNTKIHQSVLDEVRDRDPDAPIAENELDQLSIDLMVRSAMKRTPWLRLDGSELVGEIPMSAEYWEKFRRIIFDASRTEKPHFFVTLVQLITQMSELHWECNALHFRLGGLIGDVIYLQEDQDLVYDDSLLQALEEAGYHTNPDIDEISVRSWLHPEGQPTQQK